MRAAHRAAVAEVAWPGEGGLPELTAPVPLVSAGRLVFALPYAQHDLALALGTAPVAVVVLSDSRLGGRSWSPLAATVRLRLEPDPEGARFSGGLLDEELRKHPPSRALLDSAVLRREHWWYLPRLLVTVEEVLRLRPVGPRAETAHAVLAYAGSGTLDADTVEVAEAPGGGLALRSLAGRDLGALPEVGAALFTHDFSIPDRERTCARTRRGLLVGARLRVREDRGTDALDPVPGLLTRLRTQRDLRRACEQALARAGRAAGG